MILADHHIRALCAPAPEGWGGDWPRPMIEPFVPEQRRIDGGPSFGLSSMGYDIRLGRRVKSMRVSVTNHALDLRRPAADDWVQYQTSSLMLRPGEAILAESVERFCLPPDIFGTCYGKSSLARHFIHVLVTPLEPGWEGVLTLEIVNHASRPVILHAGDGICQIRFDRGDRPDVSYADRGGRYQGQVGVTGALR